MDPARERRALDAFDAAVDWPETERDNRLAALLADDPTLIDTVRALLAAERDADLMPTRLPESSPFDIDMPAPDRVGAYRPVDLIGRGGMGSVYRGERIDGGFEQTVAIKLIRGGLFTAAAADQFAQERQILARLHHPHITQLYDGGRTEDGQSYIVMELVQGAAILDHVEARGLGLKERLRLFTDICDAIDYAHSQGVVHADIKPSNVIVDPRHGVKLLDFGIAGLIGEEGPLAGRRAATPTFASPQQAAHAPASTADDIYSLGVLLQVLAGDQAGFDTELAAIVTKARAPRPEDRYPSAQDIASDIVQWGRTEPVSALPSHPLRNLWFFWRRNRLGVSLSAAAALSLVIAVAVMSALYVQANAARRQSDQRFQEVRSLSRYLLGDLTGALEQFPGTGHLRSDLAHRGRVYLEGLSRIPDAPADVRLEVAQGYAKTGDILARLGRQHVGDPRSGKVDLARAETALRQLMAGTTNRDDVSLTLAGVLVSRAAIALNGENQPRTAWTLLAEACALTDQVALRKPHAADAALARLNCQMGEAGVLDFEGRNRELHRLADKVIAGFDGLPPGADPSIVALGEGKIYNLRGNSEFYLDQKALALADYIRAGQVLERAKNLRADARVLDQLAYTTYNIAASLDDMGRKREELAWIDRGVAAADQVRTFEDSPHAWRTVNIVHLQRASALASLGRFDEAIAEASANIALRREITLRSPHDNLAVRALPVGLRPLGDIYWQAGRRREACAAYEEAQSLWRALAQSGGVLGSDRSGEVLVVDSKVAQCRPR